MGALVFLSLKGAESCSLMMVKTKKENRTPHLRKYDSQCYERQGRPDQEKASLNLVPWMLPCPPPDPKGGGIQRSSCGRAETVCLNLVTLGEDVNPRWKGVHTSHI